MCPLCRFMSILVTLEQPRESYVRILDQTDTEHAYKGSYSSGKQGCRKCRIRRIERVRNEQISGQSEWEAQCERCDGQQGERS